MKLISFLLILSLFCFSNLLAADRTVIIPLNSSAANFIWKGDWWEGVVYKKNDIVQYSGSSYICILAHKSAISNRPPGDGSIWNLLAAKGEKGDPGLTSLPVPIIWSGYCSSAASTKSLEWVEYCADTTEFNTAGGYLSVNSNGTFTVLTPGFYRINAFTIFLTQDVHNSRLMVNGQRKHHSADWSNGSFGQTYIDKTLPLQTNDTFSISYLGNGTVVYREGGSGESWLQVSYQGPLTP